MPIVQMPNGDQVSFPDNMPASQIRSLIAKKFPHDVAAYHRNIADGLSAGMSWKDAAGEAIENIPSSAVEFAKNTAQPFIHPIETAENIGSLGKGVLQKLGIVSGNDSVPYADAVGHLLVNRYGSVDAVKKTLATDPVGMAADVSLLLTGGGSAAARLPGIAGKVGEAAAAVGRGVDPLTAAGGAAKLGGRFAAEAAGITTGVGSDALKVAARAGAEGGQAGKALLENLAGNPSDVVSEAKAAVGQLRQERGNVYRTEMAKIGADTTVLDFNKIDQAVGKAEGVKTYAGRSGTGPVQQLSGKTADIRKEMTDAVDAWKQLDPAEFHTAEGIDALKQQLGDIRDATQPNTPARVAADRIYQAVRQTIVDQAPKYAEVMKGYEEASDLIREIEKTLSVNPRASVDTALRKLTSVLRNNVSTNYGRRAELVDFLQRAGAPHLMQKLAGQMLSSAMPRGLARTVAGGEIPSAAAAFALGHPAAAAALVGGLAASSPAVAGGAAYGLGAASRLPLRRIGRAAFQAGRLPEQ